MRKLSYIFIALIVLLFLAMTFLLPGCAGTKPAATDSLSDITTNSEKKKEVTQINRPIEEYRQFDFGRIRTGKPECDSVAQSAFDNNLIRLNSYIKSGENLYQMTYDLNKKSLSINSKIGQTQDKLIESEKSHDRFFLKLQTKYVEKEFSTEQKFNLWTGRAFWLLLVVFIAFKIGSKTARV